MRTLHREPAVKSLGNGSALGLISFLLSLTPLSCVLLGLRDTTSMGNLSLVGTFYGVGAAGLMIAGVLEWVAGNTYNLTVFFSFGSFWMSLAIFNDPLHAIGKTLEKDALDLYAPFGFYCLAWAVYVAFLTVAAFRVNVVFVFLLANVTLAFITLGVGNLSLGDGTMVVGSRLIQAGGGFALAACIAGYYALWNAVMASTGFPLLLPVGDLSGGPK